MNKKITSLIFFLIISIMMVIPISSVESTIVSDGASNGFIIDQSQTTTNNHRYSTLGWYLVQSFKPTISPLRRVDIFLELKVYGSGTDSLEISIKDTLNFDVEPLAQTTCNYSSLDSGQKWVEIYFDNITVIPEETYFILLDHEGAGDCFWYGNYDQDYYERGFSYGYDMTTHQWQNLSALSFFPDFDFCFKTYSQGANNPPEIINISGQVNGKEKTEQEYIITTTDLEEEKIYLYVDWGDDTNTGWIGPYLSTTEIRVDHIWDEKGSYVISTRAKDESGNIGEWYSLEVTMPMNRQKLLFRNLLFNYNSFLDFIKILVFT